MDEVENPALPAAGESSPTLGPLVHDGDPAERPREVTLPPNLTESQRPAEGAHLSSPGREPPRPFLKRDSTAPPPSQPPPAPPSQPADSSEIPQESPDSLTLADLKRIRSEFPHAHASPKQQLLEYEAVYDFAYQDAQSLPVELEEWFSYSEQEEVMLRKCKALFNQEWRAGPQGHMDWLEVTEDDRRAFVAKKIDALKGTEGTPVSALMILTYVGLGVWEETAGRPAGSALEDLFGGDPKRGSGLDRYQQSGLQLRWIIAMVGTLHACGGVAVIYDVLRRTCEESFAASPIDQPSRNEAQQKRRPESIGLWCCLTLMYLFIEVSRTTDGTGGTALKRDILALEPKLVNYFTEIVGRLRWDDYAPIPLTKMLLLAWKTILVTFGGIQEVEHVKASLRGGKSETDGHGKPVITASPLDYHLFRQEISSKYPAYQPPPPLFPLEPDNNSILPPLKHRQPSCAAPSDSVFTGAPNVGTHSIMHQPVHIATPAPSPPPSPAGPGKGGKKQNYQTNQMFPFLYPPLDEDSGQLGGKGETQLQDALVGKKWEGSDVPTSILEAAELFAKRMRATRAMKQLWETRVDFMKFERGWKSADDPDDNADVDEFELVPEPAPEETAEQGEPLTPSEEQKKLQAVDDFYRDSLPHLQSVIIVLLKAVLQNVTDLVTKCNGQNGLQVGIQFNEANGINGSTKPMDPGMHQANGMENTAEELDKLRSQEIVAKALSAILLLLLKWFKVSHILQYEYMTQLLLDSNYVPLILKLWQTQEIGRACHYQLDRDEQNFFYFCQANSRQGPPLPANPGSATLFEELESEDEAAPPPIKRDRNGGGDDEPSPIASVPQHEFQHPPEIDELGYPQTALPRAPIQNYSYRNIFSAINYLRILQKVTRRKTHRALLLVSYKSSNHLKKTLKIPIFLLRYYTLKLFKSQVPFCGRKWRQGNMKIITAVWLSIPAELRDDWLSGGGGGMGGAFVGDVDGTVEDALPLEQSLRALTHWWNVRNYPEVMGVDKQLLEEEMDYFSRELEKMELVRETEEGMGEEHGSLADADGGGWQGPVEGY